MQTISIAESFESHEFWTHGGFVDLDPNSTIDLGSGCDTVISATPSPARERGPMPRRRGQKGNKELLKKGKRREMWKGTFWEDRVQRDGSTKRVRRTVTLGPTDEVSERRAWKLYRSLLHAANEQATPVTNLHRGNTVGDAIQEWRKYVSVNNEESSTRADESRLRYHIEPRLGALPLRNLGYKPLQGFLNAVADTGVSRKTGGNVKQILRTVIETARRSGYIVPPINWSELKLPPAGPRKEMQYLTASEMDRIAQRAPEPYATMFAVFKGTGCRAGEVLGLKVNDLDLEQRVIHVRGAIDSHTRKYKAAKWGSAGDLPMSLGLAKRLKAFLESRHKENPEGFLFVNRNLRPYLQGKVLEYGLWPVQDKLGIKQTCFHAFRHGLASELVNAGVPITTVQRQLRHRDVATTLRQYVHVLGNSQREAIERMDARQLESSDRNGVKSAVNAVTTD